MRAEGGRNPYLVDLGTVKGVVDLLPDVRPGFRSDIDRRYVTLGPAEVDIGYAGRSRPESRLHRDITSLRVGDKIGIANRLLETAQRQAVGRLAARSKVDESSVLRAKVCGILVRTRDQTQAAYADSVKADRWEVVLAEVEVGGATGSP